MCKDFNRKLRPNHTSTISILRIRTRGQQQLFRTQVYESSSFQTRVLAPMTHARLDSRLASIQTTETCNIEYSLLIQAPGLEFLTTLHLALLASSRSEGGGNLLDASNCGNNFHEILFVAKSTILRTICLFIFIYLYWASHGFGTLKHCKYYLKGPLVLGPLRWWNLRFQFQHYFLGFQSVRCSDEASLFQALNSLLLLLVQ